MYPPVAVNRNATLFALLICETDSKFLLKWGADSTLGTWNSCPLLVVRLYGVVWCTVVCVPSGSVTLAVVRGSVVGLSLVYVGEQQESM